MKQTINPDTSVPYYEQIRTYLLSRIEAGEFKPHTQIPSERSLSEQFGVSRMTVKHAITELVTSGRLYTRVGKGTFVSETPITQQLDMLTGFSEDMARLGKNTHSVVLEAKKTDAASKVSEALQITLESPVIFLKRLRFADGQPVAIESSYLNQRLCEGILKHHNFAVDSLYLVLRTEYELNLHYAEQHIKARLASNNESRLLDIDAGFPILHITRTTFLRNETPIEYVESAYRGDRYVFRARLTNL